MDIQMTCLLHLFPKTSTTPPEVHRTIGPLNRRPRPRLLLGVLIPIGLLHIHGRTMVRTDMGTDEKGIRSIGGSIGVRIGQDMDISIRVPGLITTPGPSMMKMITTGVIIERGEDIQGITMRGAKVVIVASGLCPTVVIRALRTDMVITIWPRPHDLCSSHQSQ